MNHVRTNSRAEKLVGGAQQNNMTPRKLKEPERLEIFIQRNPKHARFSIEHSTGKSTAATRILSSAGQRFFLAFVYSFFRLGLPNICTEFRVVVRTKFEIKIAKQKTKKKQKKNGKGKLNIATIIIACHSWLLLAS